MNFTHIDLFSGIDIKGIGLSMPVCHNHFTGGRYGKQIY